MIPRGLRQDGHGASWLGRVRISPNRAERRAASFSDEEAEQAVANMRAEIHAAALKDGVDPKGYCFEYTAVQFSPQAELLLRYLGRWAELLGVAQVRVFIRA